MSLTKIEATEAFKEALEWANRRNYFGGVGGGGAPGAPTPGGSSGGILEPFKKEALSGASAIGALGKAGLDISGKLLIGGARVSDATNALSKNMAALDRDGTMVGKTLSFVSEAGSKLGVHLDENIDTWRHLSKTGASFGNDIIALKQQSSEARLSIAEMSEVVQKNTTNLAGLGPTVSQSIKAFSTVSNEMFKSGATENLRRMGYTTQELNDVLAVSLSNRKLTDLRDETGREKAYKAATQLATEMDAVSKITGKTREEQLKNLRQLQDDGATQAGLMLMARKFGDGAKQSFDQLYASAAKVGPEFQDVMKDVIIKGYPSEKNREIFALLGQEATKGLYEARRLTQEAGLAERAGNKERAEELKKEAQLRLNSAMEGYVAAKQSNTQLMLATNEVGNTAQSFGSVLPTVRAVNAAGGKLSDVMKEVENAQAGTEKDLVGKQIATAAKGITEFAVNVESRGRDMTKALTDQVIVPLTEKVGPSLKFFADKFAKPSAIADFEKQVKTGRVSQEAVGTVSDALKNEKTIERLNSAMEKGGKHAAEVEKLLLLLRSESTRDKATTKLEEIAKQQGVDVQKVIETAMSNKGAGVGALNRQIESVLTSEEIKKAQREKEEVKRVEKEKEKSTVGKSAAADISRGSGTTFGEGLGKAIGEMGLFISKPGLVTITKIEGNAEGGYIPKPTISFLAEKGPEFVLNEPQMKSLIEGIGTKGMMAAQDSSTINLSAMSKQISTSISSISGSSDTATKGLDSGESGLKLNLSNFAFGPNGMPMFRQAEAAKSSLPDKSPEKEAEVKALKAEAAKSLEDAKRGSRSEKEEGKSTIATSKTSTLDDVVKQLDHLNKLMSQFIYDHKEIGTKQIRAAKSMGSLNINERI